MVQVKICCIASLTEARLAIRCGAAALGFVSAMPSGPGVISEEQIASIIPFVPEGIATFLMTSKTSVAEIIGQYEKCCPSVFQLCDRVTPEVHRELKDRLPDVKLVQVVHVLGEASIEEASVQSHTVDALLLDSGNPDLATKSLGGTGRAHNWEISREIVRLSGVPVYLAGGLTPGNVAEAVRVVQPFGVDVCSGVRTEGKLDRKKLERFVGIASTT